MDLKRKRKNQKFEVEGRKQQYFAELVGAAVAIVAVFIFYKSYFMAGRIPPVAAVYKSTIEAGVAGLIFLAVRFIIEKKFGEEGTKNLNVLSAGLIAGSALFSFFTNTFKLVKKPTE